MSFVGPNCNCVCSSELRDCAELLMDGNPRLTAEAAEEYACKIAAAEYREDFILMHKLIQEALWSWGTEHVA